MVRRSEVFDFILEIALIIVLNIPTDFGSAELMIFTAPPYSVRPLHPPQDKQLTVEFLEFAKRRPYSLDIPGWWDENNVDTKEIAQRIQYLEEQNLILPPLEEVYRFPDSNSIYVQIHFGDEYIKILHERARFMLIEEQNFVEQISKQYFSMRQIYYELMAVQNHRIGYIERRTYLENVKKSIPEKLYKNGILPALLPDPLP